MMAEKPTCRVLTKIEKCLRLASSSNPGEAATALRQAQKLMAKHGIVHEDLELHRISESVRARGNTACPPSWTLDLCRLIARAFGVRFMDTVASRPADFFSNRRQYKANVSFIGLDDAPSVAGYAYDVLYRQLARDRKEYVADLPSRTRKSEKTRQGDLYAKGWLMAVERQVKGLARTPEEERLVQRWIEKEHSDAGSIGPSPDLKIDLDEASTLSAMRAGYQTGAKVALHRPVAAAEPDPQLTEH
ncbi:MAG: DUF2786 domain-containing protein [Halomonadaceae bacterium]|nr:DUF2786 domain-containing protein [Halomonadaceae bacterium]